jgi:(R)-2-hydroxyacyl-CoA dehydratese activating ATPase
MKFFAGLDIGSTMTKAVIISDKIETSFIGPTGPEHRKLANKVIEEALIKSHIRFEDLAFIIATGYGRINVPFADRQVTEITCHAKGICSIFPAVKTIIDVGGQDSKGIRVNGGKVAEFVMNDKCAAGTGRFLEIIADSLGVPLQNLGELSLSAEYSTPVSNTCTVFAEHEIASKLAEGEPLANLAAGIHDAVASRIYAMVKKLKVEPEVAVTGGGAKNTGLVKALERKFGFSLLSPPEPLITGALGAALIAKETYEKAVAGGKHLQRSSHGLEEARFFS